MFSQAVSLRLIWRLLDVEQVSDYPPVVAPKVVKNVRIHVSRYKLILYRARPIKIENIRPKYIERNVNLQREKTVFKQFKTKFCYRKFSYIVC